MRHISAPDFREMVNEEWTKTENLLTARFEEYEQGNITPISLDELEREARRNQQLSASIHKVWI